MSGGTRLDGEMPTSPEVRALASAIAREWADKGQLIEGGWQAFRHICLKDAPEEQVREMRKAFWLGAQHLHGSMMQALDPDREPTERDLVVMSNIFHELQKFRRGLGN